jgi:hypothetical protein
MVKSSGYKTEYIVVLTSFIAGWIYYLNFKVLLTTNYVYYQNVQHNLKICQYIKIKIKPTCFNYN